MSINIEKMREDFSAFFKKYENCDFEGATDEADYVKDAEELLSQYESGVESDEEKRELSKQCVHLGCKIMMYTDNPSGPVYYRKAINLQPDSYDIRWDYYTTLEEIVENEEYSTPELIRDAIDCLRFCIDYCDTPELKRENHIEYRWAELGRVYMAAKDYRSARDCFDKSFAIMPDYKVGGLLKKAKRLGNPVLRFFDGIFSVFRRKK